MESKNSQQEKAKMNKSYGPMLNAYPDSIGGSLDQMVKFLGKPELANIFQTFYILPSVFNSDLDRGFSIVDYQLNQLYATEKDLADLEKLGIDLKLDFVLNHISVLSPQFQDIIKNGLESKYADFFINWNEFWKEAGELTEEGYIQPSDEYIKKMFFRKPGLPLLMVRMPDGSKVPYWNTFYQQVIYPRLDEQDLMEAFGLQYTFASSLAQLVNEALEENKKPTQMDFKQFDEYKDKVIELLESKCRYLGQMDLNIQSPLVWDYYEQVLEQLAKYGSKIVRLDAFAYAPKEVGAANFMNEPGTWELLRQVDDIGKKHHLKLLPEIHSSYEDKTHEVLSDKGYMIYDFFLPGLIIDAIENGNLGRIEGWAEEIIRKKMHTVNMLGCHDGIPLLDLKGILEEADIEKLINIVVSRGGHVKNLHGQKNMYYQVNATYYSALGDDDRKMLLARALQVFMPGIPQVWYLDLFVGKNDHEGVKRGGEGGHKEINRTNLTMKEVEEGLKLDVVKKQLEILAFRSNFPAFNPEGKLVIETKGGVTSFVWEYLDEKAILEVNIKRMSFAIRSFVGGEEKVIIEQD